MLQLADRGRSRSAATMSGKMDERQALAAVILWKSGHFDAFDIAAVLRCGEDAVCRTLQAARHVERGQA
ncbi:hypothetical protein [Sinorhizobium meliloti]|uniref:hypothetical protein n=1 Tax=Rhizobium meliloti TaxID=382 RepID=UPI000FD8CFC2|nr:hypothetical protein [Sinorhizobium meliloti]RVE90105.1 hypothetical protein CN238_11890 [Sinorhizobium meliloti]RVH30504.1 hypothetical protein CN214_13570 [Sinorhizobium meliloti]